MNFTRKDKTMRVYILICLSLLAAPMVAAQVVYDSVARQGCEWYDVSAGVDGLDGINHH